MIYMNIIAKRYIVRKDFKMAIICKIKPELEMS